MPRFTRQNLKSLGPKKKDHVKQKAHLKESNYLKNRMRQGITFLPGFVNTGYQTSTVVKNATQSKNTENMFSESFQDLIGQKSNLRRSQRILTNQNSSRDRNCNNYGDLNRRERKQKRSKSIFKNINRQYSKRQKGHSPAYSSDKSDNSSSMFDDEVPRNSEVHLCNEDAELEQTCYHQTSPTLPNSKKFATEESYRKTFCRKIVQAIQVSFKQNSVEQAKKRIQAEVSKANAVLAGKVVKKDLNVSDDVDLTEENRDADNLILVPPRKWVYCTPNKKIATSKIEENQLEPAIMLKEGSKNRKQKVQFCTKFDDGEESHVENECFRQMAKTERTPARNAEAPFQNCIHFVNMYGEVANSMPFHECQHDTRPYYDNHHQPNEHIFEENTNMINFRNRKIDSGINEHDITVVMDGNNFEMQASQRRTNDVCFPKDSYEFNVNLNHDKMFNFNSQTSVFD